MEVYERINILLKDKNLTKREFAKRLRDLEPKLNSTGETPSEKTIYKYLNGSISIKIELIPYIAEALQIAEQELFTRDNKSRKRFFQNLIKTATLEEIEILKNKFNLKYNESSLVKEPNSTYTKDSSLESQLIELLPYSPKPLLQNFVTKLKEIKDFNETI
ncbi:helix-turn-helix transcriptional regulator [Arcobacter sp. LA11]|uniref:helix-turn-helix domain-containing protein n=1 Tax=Arcobacter sp. LA11 TaxID=1898176 RepID=UPI0009329D93|nr:helix-turn-helix transcriptional regulator [Arcobacter sp. LA11]